MDSPQKQLRIDEVRSQYEVNYLSGKRGSNPLH